MKVGEKTKEQLINELEEAHKRITALEAIETEIKRAKEALSQAHAESEQSKRYIESLIESSTDAIISTDKSGNLVLFNEGAEALSGYRREEVVGRSAPVLYEREEDAKEVMRRMRKGGGTVSGFETTFKSKDGTIIPVLISASMLYDEEGNEAGTVGFSKDLRERKRAEEALRKSEEQHRFLVETIRQGVEDIDTSGRILFANDSLHKIYGYDVEELIGKSILAMPPTASEQKELREYLKLLVREQPPPVDYVGRKRKKDGKIIDVQVAWNYKRDSQGQLIGFSSVITDITERKRAEEALLETQAFYERLVGEAGDAIFALDREGTILTWNTGAELIFGWTTKEVLGRSYLELQPPDAAEEIKTNIKRVFAGETMSNVEISRCRKDGSSLDALTTISPVRDAKGEIVAIHGIIKDITERKQAEEAIHSLKEFNENVVQSIQDGLVVIDPDFRITFWNKAMESMRGYKAEEMLGKVITEVFPHLAQQGVDELYQAALDGQTVERNNIFYQTPKGKSGYSNAWFLPLKDQAGEIIGVLSIVEDVTETVKLEEQVTRLQQEVKQRKSIEIAKGILMRELNLSEADSYRYIQKKSQDERSKMIDVTKRVIEAFGTPEERKKA